MNTKISKAEKKIPDNSRNVTAQWFNKLTPGEFLGKLKQGNLVTKTDFDNKLTSFNKSITSKKKNNRSSKETKKSIYKEL